MTRADELLEVIVEALRGNQDVKAVWLAGSHGRGEADEFSDIDIWIALDGDAIEPVVEDPLRFVHTITPTIWHILAPSIAPMGGAFLGSWVPVGDEFVQVDWYIVPDETSKRDLETMLVFGDLPIREPIELPNVTRDFAKSKADDNLALALQKINYMVRNARRGRFWSAAHSARNANRCLLNARSFLVIGAAPDFAALKESVLPGVPPTTVREVQDLAVLLLDEVQCINAEANAGLEPAIAAMRRLVEAWRESGWKPTDEYYRTLPRRYIGSGMLITDADDNILLLKTAYKKDFEVPGGVVEAGESPRGAASREVQEELGIDISPGRLLVFDTRSQSAPKGDAILMLYDGGALESTDAIQVDGEEILQIHFVPLGRLHEHCTTDMATRLRAAMSARDSGQLIEIVDGEVIS